MERHFPLSLIPLSENEMNIERVLDPAYLQSHLWDFSQNQRKIWGKILGKIIFSITAGGLYV